MAHSSKNGLLRGSALLLVGGVLGSVFSSLAGQSGSRGAAPEQTESSAVATSAVEPARYEAPAIVRHDVSGPQDAVVEAPEKGGQAAAEEDPVLVKNYETLKADYAAALKEIERLEEHSDTMEDALIDMWAAPGFRPEMMPPEQLAMWRATPQGSFFLNSTVNNSIHSISGYEQMIVADTLEVMPVVLTDLQAAEILRQAQERDVGDSAFNWYRTVEAVGGPQRVINELNDEQIARLKEEIGDQGWTSIFGNIAAKPSMLVNGGPKAGM